MNVSWEAPRFPNGVLEGYRLVYEPCTPVDGKWGPQRGSLNLPCMGSFSTGSPSTITAQSMGKHLPSL